MTPRDPRGGRDGKIGGMTTRIPVSTIFVRLGKAYNAATNAFEGATGVNAARWRLLYLISCQPGISQRELVRQVRVDPGSITRQLNSLQTEGLVERRDDTVDARVFRLVLTRRGRVEVSRVLRIRAPFLDTMVEGLSVTELRALAKALDRISVNLGDDVPLPPGLEQADDKPRRRPPRTRPTAS